ncbi:hypothetical protein EDB84DRAFT_1559955 [Lactarius hengduanensis]|nr:hypothetical protein EDB84DRAFT_1559955 [Lactarius hengduanensis]
MADYTLYYFAEGKEAPGGVIISRNATVLELRRAIYEECNSSFWDDAKVGQLVLLKVDIESTPHINVQDLSGDGGVKMNLGQHIDVVWPDQPNELHFQICVRLSGTIRPPKHPIPEPLDVHSRLKRTRLATQPPSILASSKNYASLQQNSQERLLDDRPEPDLGIPPIPLLYSGFGHFLDITHSCDNVPGITDIKVVQLRKAVDRFATNMTTLIEKEEVWREKGLDDLEKIFKARDGTKIPQISPSAIGSARSDGHNMVDGTSTIVVEFKRSLAGITALPQVEVAGYVARLDARLAKETYLRWRVPCLGLTIVDCDITFYALLAVDHRIRLTRLTPTLSCIQSASDGHDRESLYLAFTAASVLQACILEDAQTLTRILTHPITGPSTSEIPAEIPTPARCYPAISKLLKYPTTPGPNNYLFFEICGVFEGLRDRLLYKARRIERSDLGSDDKSILIKFMRQYSLDLHQFCAEAGHAPLILGYERLPGGWYAVAMEYIESGVSITNSELLTSHRDHWMMELRQLMNNFHAADLVHGDLRDTNILCKGKSVMLVDFDWGGTVGKASYPTLDLNPELLKDRASESLMITKGDDRSSPETQFDTISFQLKKDVYSRGEVDVYAPRHSSRSGDGPPRLSLLHAKIFFKERKRGWEYMVSSSTNVEYSQKPRLYSPAARNFVCYLVPTTTIVPLSNKSEQEINKKRFRFDYPPKALRPASCPGFHLVSVDLEICSEACSQAQTPIRSNSSPLKQAFKQEQDDQQDKEDGTPIRLVEGNRPQVEQDLVILEEVDAPETSTQPQAAQHVHAPQAGAHAAPGFPLAPSHQPQQFQTPRRRSARPSLHRAVLIRSAQRAAMRFEMEQEQELEEREVEEHVATTDEQMEMDEEDEGDQDAIIEEFDEEVHEDGAGEGTESDSRPIFGWRKSLETFKGSIHALCSPSRCPERDEYMEQDIAEAIQERRRSALTQPDEFFGENIPGSRRNSLGLETPNSKAMLGVASPSKIWPAIKEDEEEVETTMLLEKMKEVVEGMQRRRSMQPGAPIFDMMEI